MSNTKHTPGPWNCPTGFEDTSPTDHGGMPLFAGDNPFDAIAIILPRPECNKNAELLRAATDIANALKALLGDFEYVVRETKFKGGNPDDSYAAKKARAALTKAGVQ